MVEDYEEVGDVLQDYKVENDGIWLSWSDLWKLDGRAVRNATKALNGEPDGVRQMMFQSFVGQRMLIEDLAELVRPKKENEDN